MAKAATKTNKTTRSPRRTTVSNNNKNTRSKTASTKNTKLETEVEEKPKKATTSRRTSTTKTTGRTQTKKTATPKKTETKASTNSRKRKSATGSSASTRKTATKTATKTTRATKATTKPKEIGTTKASTSKTSARGKAAGASSQEIKTTNRKAPAKKTTNTRKPAASRKTSGTTNRRTNSRTNSRRKKEEEIQNEETILEVPTEEVVILEEEEVHHDFSEEQPEEEHHDSKSSDDDIIDVELFDENTVDKAIDLVNVAFVHHTSKIMDYREGNRLIVKDTLGNRYKLNLKPSHNPIVDPKVSSFYVMRPANFREGETFESELFALFSSEEVATLFLANIVEIHDKNGNKVEGDEPYNHADKRNQLINIHSSYLQSNSGISAVIDWCMKNKKLVLSLSGIVLFLIAAFFVLSSVFSSKHDGSTGYNKSHKSYVTLSPTEEKIRADNTVIAEINRIQNNEPPIGSVGTNIRSHGLDAEKLALLKKNMQEDVAKLIELQGQLNSGMGAQTGGHSVPFNSQTDRFGISNVPPEDSWSTSTGARMSVPSGSNGVASQKDLAEFGIIN